MKKRVCLYFMMMLCMVMCLSISKEAKATTKYHSSAQAQLPKTKEGYQKLVKICSVQGNTVTYQEAKMIFVEDAVEYKLGKVKKAKLTGKTSYYVGNRKKFNCRLGGTWYTNGSKWIGQENKTVFKNKCSRRIESAIVVRNGVVQKVFTKICMAE